jgi:hypothetical protein
VENLIQTLLGSFYLTFRVEWGKKVLIKIYHQTAKEKMVGATCAYFVLERFKIFHLNMNKIIFRIYSLLKLLLCVVEGWAENLLFGKSLLNSQPFVCWDSSWIQHCLVILEGQNYELLLWTLALFYKHRENHVKKIRWFDFTSKYMVVNIAKFCSLTYIDQPSI